MDRIKELKRELAACEANRANFLQSCYSQGNMLSPEAQEKHFHILYESNRIELALTKEQLRVCKEGLLAEAIADPDALFEKLEDEWDGLETTEILRDFAERVIASIWREEGEAGQ